jgi:hypothetical protein
MPEPRIFRAGDPEPTDVAEVQHTSSQCFQACVTVELVAGVEVSRSQCWTDGGGDPLDWADLTRRLGSCTLTEVARPDQGGLTGSSVIVEDIRPAASAGRSDTNGGAPAPGDAGNDLGQLRTAITAALIADEDVCAYADSDIVDDRLSAVANTAARALLAAGWLPPGDAEWGVDRGAVFSLHDDAADATEVFSRCLANGVRARLLRRTVGPWTPVTA